MRILHRVTRIDSEVAIEGGLIAFSRFSCRDARDTGHSEELQSPKFTVDDE